MFEKKQTGNPNRSRGLRPQDRRQVSGVLSKRPSLATQLNRDWHRKASVAFGSLLRAGVKERALL